MNVFRKKPVWICAITACLLFSAPVAAKKAHTEKWYQSQQCSKVDGLIEARVVKDRFVRIDCLTENYAIEVDFSTKHYEALGQSLYYAAISDRKAGIWLIIESPKDMRHAVRLVRNIRLNKLPITVWTLKNIQGSTPKFELYYQ